MTVVHLNEDGKTPSIVSYLTIIGWLIAYFALHKGKETSLGSYHLRQTLLFYIVAFIVSTLLGVITMITGSYAPMVGGLATMVNLVIFIFWVIGLVAAIQSKKKPIPFIGEKAQTMFPSI